MNLTEYTFFPLGTRCSSAGTIYDLGKRKHAYPFDWMDIELSSILPFLNIDRGEISDYLTAYFLGVNKKTMRSDIDNTWFPHDFGKGYVSTKKVIEKYLRRFNRMHDLFESGKNIAFLTIIARADDNNRAPYIGIQNKLQGIVKGNVAFISVNLSDQQLGGDNFTNLVIPIGDSWDTFHDEIKKQIPYNFL